MKFDWYQATIKDDPGRIFEVLRSGLGDDFEINPRVGKLYQYTEGAIIKKQGNPVAFMAYGFNKGGAGQELAHGAHCWATSDDAVPFAALVRSEWPDSHLVTRLDACEDFIDATAFKRLCRVGRKVAKEHRLKFPRIEDALDQTAGRTQYLGSPKSEYRGRIYEKGWEVVGKACGGLNNRIRPQDVDNVRVPGIDRACHPSEWIRAELQARPKGETARASAARATPEEVWTFSDWTQDFSKEAFALDLERFYIRQRKFTSDERALKFMCSQYGKMLERLCGDLGDWACVGNQIGQTIKDVAEQMKEIRQGR